ncbi:MAG: prepilin-type N-terminal cleavage/methylation domain-containing protein [Actinomycetota bacterium]
MSAFTTRHLRRAFTLIELLVVIAIIALLISILLPSLASARDNGRTVVCASNVRQLVIASAAYANANKGFFSSGNWDNRRFRSLGPLDTHGWVADMVNGDYFLPGKFLCPSSPAKGSEVWNETKVRGSGAWRSISDAEVQQLIRAGFNTNYTQSWYMAYTDGKTDALLPESKDTRFTRGPLRESAMGFAPPSLVPMFGDTKAELLDANNSLVIEGERVVGCKAVSDGPGVALTPQGRDVLGRQDYVDFGPAHGRSSKVTVGQIRHDRTYANMAFADGSVRVLSDRLKRDGLFSGEFRMLESGWGAMVYDDIEGQVFGGWLTRDGLNW